MEYDMIKNQVKDILMLKEDLSGEDNLLELGLNSLQVMRMVAFFRKQGIKISFGELIEQPTLKAWYKLTNKEITSTITLPDKKADASLKKNNPFQLSDVQKAYLIGRRDEQVLGGVSCHAYFEFDGEGVDYQRLKESWNEVQMHHSMLRAAFLPNGTQRIMDTPYSQEIFVNDLRLSTDKEQRSNISKIRERIAARKLNVEEGQVAGLEITLLPNNKTKLHIDIDLLIADVESIKIIFRDLLTAYENKSLPLLSKKWSFSNYLNQQKVAEEADYERAKCYWINRLKNFPVGPILPKKKHDEAVRQVVFKRRRLNVSSFQWEAIKEKASNYKTTPAMILLSAYAAVLERWSENSRFLINIPIFSRNNIIAGTEDAVADFTTLLLLEVNCSDNPTFLELCNRISKQFYQDMKYSAFNAIQVQKEWSKMHGEKRNLAPVVYACNLGMKLVNEQFEKKLGKFSYMVSQTPQVWIDFQVYEMENGIILTWDSVDELFPENMIDEMFESLGKAVHFLSSQSWNQPFDAWDKVNEFALSKMPIDWNFEGKLLHECFFEMTKKCPDKPAIIVDEKKYSYQSLQKQVLGVASGLIKKGIERTPVAIIMPRGINQVIAILAILVTGNVYVPVSYNQPNERILTILEKNGIKHVIIDNEISYLDKDCINVWDINDLCSDEFAKEFPQISPNDTAYIIMTSGSTGVPKGVEITHKSAWNTINDINEKYRVCEKDLFFAISDMSFDLSVFDLFAALSVGASILLIPEEKRRDTEYWINSIVTNGVTIWNSVPILFDMLLTAAKAENVKLPIRLTLLSGDWVNLDIPSKIVECAEKSKLIVLGGATECSVWSNYYEVTWPIPQEWKSIPYGRPLRNQAFRVVDQYGRDCPPWVKGELYIGGIGLSKGYRGDADLTDRKFVNDKYGRWYKTGDIGKFWNNGIIELLGREDNQVKIRGYRIELGDVESTINSMEEIDYSAVFYANSKMYAYYHLRERDIREQPYKKRESLIIEEKDSSLRNTYMTVLDSITMLVILGIIKESRCFEKAKNGLSLSEIIHACEISISYETLFEIWLKVLEREGVLRYVEFKYYCTKNISEINDEIKKQFQSSIDSEHGIFPAVDSVITLAKGIGRVIKGEITIQEIISEGIFTITPEKISGLPDQKRVLDDVVKRVSTILSTMNGSIRVLEIGGYSKIVATNIPKQILQEVQEYKIVFPAGTKKANPFLEDDNIPINQKNIDFNSEIFSYSCGGEKFDLIIAYQSLHLSHNIGDFLNAIHKTLKPGGTLLLVEPTNNSKYVIAMMGLLENKYTQYTDCRKGKGELLPDLKYIEKMLNNNYKIISEKKYSTFDEKIFIESKKLTNKWRYSAEDIYEYLENRLPTYMIPQTFIEIDRLPISENGKKDRKKLASYLKEIESDKKGHSAPSNEFAIAVMDVFKTILVQKEVFLDENFFSLGGDSLRAVQCVNQIKEKFDIKLELIEIFESKTFADILEILEKKKKVIQNTVITGEI